MLYLFDLDGTILRAYLDLPDKNYHHVEVLPGRQEKLAALRKDGHTLGIVTNQGGIAFGYNTEADFWSKLHKVLQTLGLSPELVGVSVCFSDPRSKNPAYNDALDCARRKPSGAMIRERMAAQPVAAHEGVIYVGDRPEDEQAAQDAGVPFAWADAFFVTR